MKPQEIEDQSFAIIDAEAQPHDFDHRHWQVVRRVIHTSADFEWQGMMRFHPEAIPLGIAAIRQGRPIITDTNMARVGIRSRDLARFGGEVRCYMTDPRVADRAAAEGITRAKAAVDLAAEEMTGGIYVVGNAPTALLRLLELAAEDKDAPAKDAPAKAAPALVIGLPVGFVNAAESKAALMESDLPFIANIGRKGGSNVAAAVVNALILLALGDDI
jgi:precorrin-8X/cobalt-precorrin-8 methylmutase